MAVFRIQNRDLSPWQWPEVMVNQKYHHQMSPTSSEESACKGGWSCWMHRQQPSNKSTVLPGHLCLGISLLKPKS